MSPCENGRTFGSLAACEGLGEDLVLGLQPPKLGGESDEVVRLTGQRGDGQGLVPGLPGGGRDGLRVVAMRAAHGDVAGGQVNDYLVLLAECELFTATGVRGLRR